MPGVCLLPGCHPCLGLPEGIKEQVVLKLPYLSFAFQFAVMTVSRNLISSCIQTAPPHRQPSARRYRHCPREEPVETQKSWVQTQRLQCQRPGAWFVAPNSQHRMMPTSISGPSTRRTKSATWPLSPFPLPTLLQISLVPSQADPTQMPSFWESLS